MAKCSGQRGGPRAGSAGTRAVHSPKWHNLVPASAEGAGAEGVGAEGAAEEGAAEEGAAAEGAAAEGVIRVTKFFQSSRLSSRRLSAALELAALLRVRVRVKVGA